MIHSSGLLNRDWRFSSSFISHFIDFCFLVIFFFFCIYMCVYVNLRMSLIYYSMSFKWIYCCSFPNECDFISFSMYENWDWLNWRENISRIIEFEEERMKFITSWRDTFCNGMFGFEVDFYFAGSLRMSVLIFVLFWEGFLKINFASILEIIDFQTTNILKHERASFSNLG